MTQANNRPTVEQLERRIKTFLVHYSDETNAGLPLPLHYYTDFPKQAALDIWGNWPQATAEADLIERQRRLIGDLVDDIEFLHGLLDPSKVLALSGSSSDPSPRMQTVRDDVKRAREYLGTEEVSRG